jgi:serine phosphatase RsbU (regulator of sigma subunit)
MQLAAEIQRRILPKGAPAVPGWELAGWNRPARRVGGDYYDFLPLAGGRLGITVGDVSGKGMPAALLVSTLHSAVRLLLENGALDADLLQRLNRHILVSSTPNKFITLLVADLEPRAGVLRYLNAGHNPGLVVRAQGGAVEALRPGGLPLGMLPGAAYRADSLALLPGDLLCLYSDGITECVSPAEEEFAVERLTALLRAERQSPLHEVIAAIDHATTEFACGQPQGDDQTLVLLRRAAV